MDGTSITLLTTCETDSNNGYQVCYMPVKLMKILQLNCEDVAYLSIGEKGLICRVLPKFSLSSNPDFEVIASYQVMHNVSHLKDFHSEENIKIPVKNVTLLTVKDITEIIVSIVMVSVDNVVKARKCLNSFKQSVKSLLQLYKVMDNTIISCLSNSLAEFLGIAYIIINDTILKKQKEKIKFIGRIISETEVTILSIESEERHLSLIKNYPILGGLEPILTDLKNMAFCRWNYFTNMETSFGGVLLVGPPGCGKSSLVQRLCYETRASYISTAAAELQSPYEGETFKNFAKVARKACYLSKEGPCIFFIDEIDSLGFVRSEELNVDDSHLTNQALSILDDCGKYANLFIMAATNRPYVLDKNFLFTDRLEIKILLSAPTLNQRKEILDIYCKDFLSEADSVLWEIALATPGFVGADLKFLCEKIGEKYQLKEPVLVNSSVVYEEMMQLLSQFSPSIHKSLEFYSEKPKFVPVGGLNQIKRKLDILLSGYSKFGMKHKNSWLKKPRGILFYGPRGCGKTRLVARLASQKGYSFISATASHLLSSYVGESEKRIASLFHSARLAQPSVIFIDEIDGIFGSRESSSKGVKVNIITELLQAMDGGAVGSMSQQGSSKMSNSHEDIQEDFLVCSATNHPEKLDSALIRPGRFDHLIYVPPPDEEERFEILKLKSSSIKISEKMLKEIAARSERWTGSELENLINNAVTKLLLSGHIPVDAVEINMPEEMLWEEFNTYSPSLLPKDLKRYELFSEKFK